MIKTSIFVVALVILTYCDANVLPDDGFRNVGDVPRGRIINIGNLPVYEAPDNVNSRRMLIGIHDIFGFSNNTHTRQVADAMALQFGGFRVVLPDFFRGEGWDRNWPVDPNNSPPELLQFLERVANWNNNVRPDILSVLNFYRSQGVQEFGIYGQCWGGRIAVLAAIELFNDFSASAFVHPLYVQNAQAPAVRVPMYIIPSRDEPDFLPFYQVIRANFGDNSGHRRFDNMAHGFTSTIGNFNDPLNRSNVNEVINTFGQFFERILQA